ncbi:MAG: hypothetical protein BWY52_00392 [Chloroflexi bacterium ADurb.Bin325]|nr:MAG: hypothetical protein BWY52_00392 [Chloroflexi bacterium ADurb.Bin325]
MIPSSLLDRLLNIALSPALWLSVLLAFIYSTLFTLWRGGGWGQWPRDLALGLAGFGAGHLVGLLTGLDWLRIGDVQLLWGSLGALIALFLGRRIWRRQDDQPVF